MGEELDVWKCWGSSFGFFLWLCSRVVEEPLVCCACLLQILA